MHNHLSAPALLNQVRRAFEQVHDPRRYGQQFSLADVLMSGLAVFGLKFPSLLKFDQNRNEVRIRANLQSLYGVNQAPCDTQLRAVCDQVNPAELRAPFIHIHQRLYDHRLLENFRYLEGFLFSIDGTGQFAWSSLIVAGKMETGVTSRARPWFRRRGEAGRVGVGLDSGHRAGSFRVGCNGS